MALAAPTMAVGAFIKWAQENGAVLVTGEPRVVWRFGQDTGIVRPRHLILDGHPPLPMPENDDGRLDGYAVHLWRKQWGIESPLPPMQMDEDLRPPSTV